MHTVLGKVEDAVVVKHLAHKKGHVSVLNSRFFSFNSARFSCSFNLQKILNEISIFLTADTFGLTAFTRRNSAIISFSLYII